MMKMIPPHTNLIDKKDASLHLHHLFMFTFFIFLPHHPCLSSSYFLPLNFLFPPSLFRSPSYHEESDDHQMLFFLLRIHFSFFPNNFSFFWIESMDWFHFVPFLRYTNLYSVLSSPFPPSIFPFHKSVSPTTCFFFPNLLIQNLCCYKFLSLFSDFQQLSSVSKKRKRGTERRRERDWRDKM